MSNFWISDNDRRAIAEAQRVVASQTFAEVQPALERFADQQRQLLAAVTPGLQRFVQQYSDYVAALRPDIDRFVEQIRSTFVALQPTFAALAEHLERLVPSNIRGRFADLDELWALAVETGIGICWVPRIGVLDDVRAAPTTEDRMDVLVAQRAEILEDCLGVLAPVRTRGADACRSAIAAAADGHHSAAQSLAGNVIDSFVLANVEGRPTTRRLRAREWASEGYAEDEALRNLFDVIALAPIITAFEKWWPGDDPPRTFNRHATAHAAGEHAIYCERFSIVALIAAVSITRHFHDHRPGLIPLWQRTIDEVAGDG